MNQNKLIGNGYFTNYSLIQISELNAFNLLIIKDILFFTGKEIKNKLFQQFKFHPAVFLPVFF